MFYKENNDDELRLGDVLEGYVLSSISIKKPKQTEYKVDVKAPEYCAILTPCCSIENGEMLLSPLIHVLRDFSKNEYFAEDLTRINKKMQPKQKFPVHEWNDFTQNKKLEIESKGALQYSNVNYFIFEPHDKLKKYELNHQLINYYMIDFKRTHRLTCPMIKRRERMVPDDMEILQSKMLQLSDSVREDLRNKLSYFYWRPGED